MGYHAALDPLSLREIVVALNLTLFKQHEFKRSVQNILSTSMAAAYKNKTFLNQIIADGDTTKARQINSKSSSTDQILPCDVIQHILSFQPFESHSNCVNKEWNKLSKQNEINYYSNLQKRLDKTSPIKYDKQENSTYIVHKNRTELTEIEKRLDFKANK